ncbi:MAG: NAD(P)H-hydrate dehydratase, partial [Candidatus Methanomethylophilaceae archaeon]|nr:NAD(P)H-hydrate dehydratase [Candidatus Methanomethylophilaceae archaeon]
MVRCLGGDVLSPEDVPAIEAACSKADAVLIGPGLGTAPETAEAVRALVSRIKVPIVIDADGLTCSGSDVPDLKNVILTPHSRELSRLTGKDDPSDEEVLQFCKERGCVILRKGPVDRIYSPSGMRSNKTGTPGMTVGGTGDVLAGLVAGLVSKDMSGFDAACLGAYISGAAGELAFTAHSYGMSATDVIDNIGRVLKEGLE